MDDDGCKTPKREVMMKPFTSHPATQTDAREIYKLDEEQVIEAIVMWMETQGVTRTGRVKISYPHDQSRDRLLKIYYSRPEGNKL